MQVTNERSTADRRRVETASGFDTATLRSMVKYLSDELRTVLFRITPEQKAQLVEDARKAGMRQNAYIEYKLFGAIRPREGTGPSPYLKQQDEELPLTG